MKPYIHPTASQIIKELEPISASGIGSYQIFQDFLDITHASLERLPMHVRAALSNQPLTDTPETAQLFVRMKEKYKERHWQRIEQAFRVLLEGSAEEYQDMLGQVFEAFGSPNSKAGQFFTPWPVSQMCAQMLMSNIEQEVHERIKQACADNIFAQSLLFASQVLDGSVAEEFFFDRFLPVVLPDVRPILVCDPACGSGGMLLAAASICPRWVLDYNLVRFHGMDIDQRCVRMAQINMMLYGLNGYSIKCALAMTPGEMAVVPEPWREKYQEAQQADLVGDIVKVDAIRQEVQDWKQSSLF